ncbi:MAG: DEAD/DEAH box helicase, partial [Selenomonadaceae bacterium]|nr:DEAD/DEAH box helicase [Selenomonadaceae bacterium]
MNIQDLGVSEELSEALKKQQIEKAFPVQEQVIPKMLAGENVAAIAPTGTGKTLAYLLPALMQIDAADQSPQAVVLAPTYELAMQIARTAQELTQAAGLPIRTAGLVGGANTARQIERLKKKKPQLITGSAGRLIELAQKGKLRLHDVSLLVLDEFDRLFDAQNMEHTAAFVQMLRKARGERPISYALFSATAPKKALEQADFLDHPALIRVEAAPEDLARIEHYAMVVPFRDKIQRVRKLTRRLGVKRGLVFTNRVFD